MGYDMYVEEREGLTEAEAYFRLDVGGMGVAREVMEDAGMLHWQDHPPFPSYPGEADEYERKLELVLGFVAEAPGIAGVKLGSNDGWLVQPDEIRTALEAHDEWKAHNALMTMPEWWGGWLAFLRRAETDGGFRVW